MILVIDNFDSFVHNIARYVREAGHDVLVIRNNSMSPEECLNLQPSGVLISPGPGRPADAGMSKRLIEILPPALPLLGVCLGHQCLVEVFGGKTVRARRPMHGEASAIFHNGEGIFAGIASPAFAGRYHSLIAKLAPNSGLEQTAWSEDGELMGAAHRSRPWWGVQFHPESVLSAKGRRMIENFTNYCERK